MDGPLLELTMYTIVQSTCMHIMVVIYVSLVHYSTPRHDSISKDSIPKDIISKDSVSKDSPVFKPQSNTRVIEGYSQVVNCAPPDHNKSTSKCKKFNGSIKEKPVETPVPLGSYETVTVVRDSVDFVKQFFLNVATAVYTIHTYHTHKPRTNLLPEYNANFSSCTNE